jgi:ribosome biogenesis GTPase
VELIPFESGWIADTPGFSKLAFPQMDSVSLKENYPDFIHLSSQCRFNECTHIHEPGCKVIEAYRRGEIPQERYQNYVRFFQEIKATKPQY